MSVKCEPNNFRVTSCDSGNLRVVSYNLTSLWFASCELIIRLWVGSRISLHYIKSSLSVYIISSLYAKQSKSNEVIIPITIYTPESNRKIYSDLNAKELEKYASIKQTNYRSSSLQVWFPYRLWKTPRKATAVKSFYSTVTGLVILLKQDPTTGVFTFKYFRADICLCNTSRFLLLSL